MQECHIKQELSKPEKKTPEAAFPQIKKDFEKLQIVNTEKLQKNSIGNNLNYKLIADAASGTFAAAAIATSAPLDSPTTQKRSMPQSASTLSITSRSSSRFAQRSSPSSPTLAATPWPILRGSDAGARK